MWLRNFVEKHSVTTFKIGTVDVDGIWRGKRIATDYFLNQVAQSGTRICNILFGWDLQDVPIPGLAYTGWHSGYPDIVLVPDLSTLALVPWEPGTASVICDAVEVDGSPVELAPRSLLKSVVERCHRQAFEAWFGYELEFYILSGTPNELEQRRYSNLRPLTQGNHTYSVYRDTASEVILGEIRRFLAEYGIPIEASNSEHGPGQFEVNLRYRPALEAADQAMVLKHSIKEITARHGCTATFIAKLSEACAGSSGHLHQSLTSLESGEPVFANPSDSAQLSGLGTAYLAGVLGLSRDLTAIHLPYVNSYKRTAGGSWAGSTATWGVDNRTVAFRSIPSAGPAARIENRIAGADANPYLVIAANLAAGLRGIEDQQVPPPPSVGNAYESATSDDALPASLDEATDLLAASRRARSLLGDAFVDHFVSTRRWEVRQQRAAVTDWELARYLEHS
jgi:glutamine synthetase